MAAGYIGVGGKAKKIKGIYFGVGGVAKKVKKAYIGIGGVAKLWYTSGPPIERYGLATALTNACMSSNCARAGSYLLCGMYQVSVNKVMTYNTSLTQSSVSNYASTASNTSRAATTITAGAMFCFGTQYYSLYNSSLTKTDYSVGSAPYWLTFTSNGTAVIGGTNNSAAVYSLNSSGTSSSLASSGSVTGGGKWSVSPTGVSFNNNAIFAGGYYSSTESHYSNVKRWDQSGTGSALTAMNVAQSYMGQGASDYYAIFSGGESSSSSYPAYHVYNTSFTRSTFANPEEIRGKIGCGKGEYIVFAGAGYSEAAGTTSSKGYTQTVFMIDKSLTKTDLEGLSESKQFSHIGGDPAGYVGKYILFPGGRLSSSSHPGSTSVDVYQMV